jgi:hypothetical protein
MMFHRILFFSLYQVLLDKDQRQALRKLGKKRKNIFQRGSSLLEEFFFGTEQDQLVRHSRIEAFWRGEHHMRNFRQAKKDIDNLKEECRRLDIPSWIIGYEAPD